MTLWRASLLVFIRGASRRFSCILWFLTPDHLLGADASLTGFCKIHLHVKYTGLVVCVCVGSGSGSWEGGARRMLFRWRYQHGSLFSKIKASKVSHGFLLFGTRVMFLLRQVMHLHVLVACSLEASTSAPPLFSPLSLCFFPILIVSPLSSIHSGREPPSKCLRADGRLLNPPLAPSIAFPPLAPEVRSLGRVARVLW